jgi:hypothetical protein
VGEGVGARCVYHSLPCSYNNQKFIELFSHLKSDFSWNTTDGARLNDYSSCPFYYKSIIDLKAGKLKIKNMDQV